MITFGTAPGQTPTLALGSYLMLEKLGDNTLTQGGWG